MGWVCVLGVVGYFALAARATTLMLLPDDRLEGKARVQFEAAIEVQGRRGDILDRHGVILATSVDLHDLHADPSKLDADARSALARELAPRIGQPVKKLTHRLGIPGRRDVLLAQDLTPAAAGRIKQAVRTLGSERGDRALRSSLWTTRESRRFYPGKHEAAPLLGLVGHRGTGLAGLERQLERTLQGDRYKYIQWQDRKGRQITPDTVHVGDGTTVVTTIDRQIQQAAEEALATQMEVTGAQAAYMVVVDVRTGEILALANQPSQNPNTTQGLKLAALKNRAVMDAIEPGSVFKPFIAAAALEEGVVSPNTVIHCEDGRWRVGRSIIHDDHPRGASTVTEIIKYSSNIGAAKLAFELGAERSLGYLSDFGFARSTGLGLPGETRGIMRRPDRIKPIELATTSYGHGVTTNAVQLAMAVAALGNDGVRMKPHLVKEHRDADGEVAAVFAPEKDRRVVSAETARLTLRMMETVLEDGGTGTRARVPGYRVAGKTGTAWKHVDGGYSDTDRIGSFVGLLPADNPRLAMAVVVDTPTIGRSYGGVVAGPAFSMVGSAAMRILGVPPDPDADLPTDDEPLGGGPTEPPVPMTTPELQWLASGELRLPNLSGLSMRDTLVTLQGAGLSITTIGSGRVAQQRPLPGAALSPGDRVEVILQ